jgi:hypothetical protein
VIPLQEVDKQPYRAATGKAHIADPWLPEPYDDWIDGGWTVYTLCGLMLRRTEPVTGRTDLCLTCAYKAVQSQPGAV